MLTVGLIAYTNLFFLMADTIVVTTCLACEMILDPKEAKWALAHDKCPRCTRSKGFEESSIPVEGSTAVQHLRLVGGS